MAATMIRRISIALLGVGAICGMLSDGIPSRAPMALGGYRVLAADFHIHSSTWSDGTLTPFGLVLEAERQGLDVIAITGHNQVSDSKAGRWFANLVGGPVVVVGQEILAPGHHVIAVGVDRLVDSHLSVAEQIRDVHSQGGVAIAAHPLSGFWPAYDAAALAALDGTEICHPLIYGAESIQRELERFAERAPRRPAAIGSSDFHGFGRMGMCRTYVFAADATADAVIDAVRERRTVVYGFGGHAYGDPALVALASMHPELREAATTDRPATWLDWLSRVTAVFGVLGIVLAWPGTDQAQVLRWASFHADTRTSPETTRSRKP
jgi:hypothetical protein